MARPNACLGMQSGAFLWGGKCAQKAVLRDGDRMGLPRAGVHGDRI